MGDLAEDRIRILCVDDEPGFAATACAVLEGEDDRFAAESVTSVSDGRALLADGEFDCVVSDYDMPDETGIEFLESVREERPDFPFLLFTGKGSEEVASEAISAGVTDYIQKTTGTEQYALLANRIVNAVERYRSKRRLDRRTAELETAHERIEFALNATDSYVYEVDLETGSETRYGAFDRIFGTESDDIPTSERFYDRAIHPRDRDRVERLQDRETLRGRTESFTYEYRTHPETGDVRWLQSEAYVQHGPDGDPQTLVGLATDVTEHKSRQRERNRYEEVVESTEDGIYVFDASAQFRFVNQRVVDVSAIPSHAWVDEHVSILADLGTLTEAEVTAVEDGIEAIAAGDRSEVRIELTPDVPHDLEVIELRLAPFRTPEDDIRVIGYSRDITALKTREEKIERLQHRTQALMATCTLEETAQVAVDAAREVLGAELSGFYRMTDGGERLELVTETETLREAFDAVPAGDGTVDSDPLDAVVWETMNAGEPRFVDDTTAVERLAGNAPAGSGVVYPVEEQGVFVVSSTEANAFDETDERLINILGATLTTALQRVERETVLRERERELKQQNERLEDFASVVSHDLRNPLTVARGRLELLEVEDESEQIDVIRRAHDRMETMINDVLALARHGEMARDLEPVVLSDAVRQCWQHVETADAQLVVDTERTIRADRSLLQQLIENLMRNAVEHAGPTVTVTVGDVEDGFYIADDGPGIPDDPRGQMPDSGDTSGDETGLGLKIVEQVVDVHGWELRLSESESGGVRIEVDDVGLASETDTSSSD